MKSKAGYVSMLFTITMMMLAISWGNALGKEKKTDDFGGAACL